MQPHVSPAQALAQAPARSALPIPTDAAALSEAVEAGGGNSEKADLSIPGPAVASQTQPIVAQIKPLPASILLENVLRPHRRHHHGPQHGNEPSDRSRRVKTSFTDLDEYVLGGGAERGVVIGISSSDSALDHDGGGGVGRLISLHLLATVLLSNPLAKASIIDSIGSFPVSLLAKVIRSRAESYSTENRHRSKEQVHQPGSDQHVQEILRRVAISRVFDIEGAWEVLSEISTDCYSLVPTWNDSGFTSTEGKDPKVDSGQKETVVQSVVGSKDPGLETKVDAVVELEIGDSEAEEDDGLTLDDEPDDANNLVPDVAKAPPHDTGTLLSHGGGPNIEKTPQNKGRTEIVIIDNMAAPIHELFSRRERDSAHTLLSTFSRTLRSLTQTHNILTILLNNLTKPPDVSAPRRGGGPSLQKPGVSVFAATAARPALGRLFTDMLALHIFATTVPKTSKDAELLYASAPPSSSDVAPPALHLAPRAPEPPAVRYAHVVEVLKDTAPDIDAWLMPPAADGARRKRFNRVQRWAAFDVTPDRLALKSVSFGSEAGLSAAGGATSTRIAKQFPFGRRV